MSLTRTLHQGFTLVELLIALTLALIISSTVLALVQHRQRLYRDLDALLAVRMRTHDATAILSAELRGATDSIWNATDTAVELSTTVGVGVVCAVPGGAPSGRTLLELVPDSTDVAPSSFLTTPDSLDAVTIYHDSSTLAPTRGWSRYALLHTSRPLTKTSCPPITSGFTTPADVANGRRSYELLLASIPFPTPRPGSPVRVVRHARYSLYRASDALWYLGYHRCDLATLTTCSAIQPVSGPYAGQTPPLIFRYYDANGIERTPTAPTTDVTRIDVIAYAATPTAVRLPGAMNTPFIDSSRTTIALRNTQ